MSVKQCVGVRKPRRQSRPSTSPLSPHFPLLHSDRNAVVLTWFESLVWRQTKHCQTTRIKRRVIVHLERANCHHLLQQPRVSSAQQTRWMAPALPRVFGSIDALDGCGFATRFGVWSTAVDQRVLGCPLCTNHLHLVRRHVSRLPGLDRRVRSLPVHRLINTLDGHGFTAQFGVWPSIVDQRVFGHPLCANHHCPVCHHVSCLPNPSLSGPTSSLITW